jgi:hypothetical protein
VCFGFQKMTTDSDIRNKNKTFETTALSLIYHISNTKKADYSFFFVNDNKICYGSDKQDVKKKTYWWITLNYGTWYLLERTNNAKRLSYSSFQTTSQPNFQVLSFLRNSNDLTADPRRTEKTNRPFITYCERNINEKRQRGHWRHNAYEIGH